MNTPPTIMTLDRAARVLRDAGASDSDIARLLSGPPAGLRDEFAGRAMAAIVIADPMRKFGDLCETSYAIADAMMIARRGA